MRDASLNLRTYDGYVWNGSVETRGRSFFPPGWGPAGEPGGNPPPFLRRAEFLRASTLRLVLNGGKNILWGLFEKDPASAGLRPPKI